MKKFLMIVIISTMAITSVFSNIYHERYDGEPFEDSTRLDILFRFNWDYIQKFVFSDVSEVKDGNFEDLFDSTGLDYMTMSTLDSNRLRNDSNLYVHWYIQPLAPMDRLTIEMPAPLKMSEQDQLDWYASIDGGRVIGGKNGYGSANGATLYERDKSQPILNNGNSVQLRLWTEDISGKKAGNYTGSLVLRVYGES